MNSDSLEAILHDLLKELHRYHGFSLIGERVLELDKRLTDLSLAKSAISIRSCCGGTTKHEFRGGPFDKERINNA